MVVFVYELICCGFESRCSHLNLRYHTCFEQGVPWHSGNSRVRIHSETCNDMVRTYSLKIAVYGIEEIKRLKTESNFTIYEATQPNKCIVCTKIIMSQFLSTLEGRKRVVGRALRPGNSFHTSVNKN